MAGLGHLDNAVCRGPRAQNEEGKGLDRPGGESKGKSSVLDKHLLLSH